MEFVWIADNDRTPDQWPAAIEKDKIGMFHHLLRGIKQTSPGVFDRSECRSKAYNVNSLPTKYLIGADGKIIGKVSDSELDEKLQEIFGF